MTSAEIIIKLKNLADFYNEQSKTYLQRANLLRKNGKDYAEDQARAQAHRLDAEQLWYFIHSLGV